MRYMVTGVSESGDAYLASTIWKEKPTDEELKELALAWDSTPELDGPGDYGSYVHLSVNEISNHPGTDVRNVPITPKMLERIGIKSTRMRCRLCRRGAKEINGYLHRVNGKGVIGIWECRPSCDTDISNEDAIMQAITGECND